MDLRGLEVYGFKGFRGFKNLRGLRAWVDLARWVLREWLGIYAKPLRGVATTKVILIFNDITIYTYPKLHIQTPSESHF